MRNRPHGFDIYLVNVKTIRTIAHIFVAFSEKLNFTDIERPRHPRQKCVSKFIRRPASVAEEWGYGVLYNLSTR